MNFLSINRGNDYYRWILGDVRMTCIKEIDDKSVMLCAVLYQNAYMEEPWNENYSIDDVVNYINCFMKSQTKRAYMLLFEEKIIGMALGLIVPCIGSDYFRIEDICIAPEYQSRGFGSKFIQLISDCVASEKCDSILLGTQKGYPAHSFYLKNGFREIDSALLYRSLGR